MYVDSGTGPQASDSAGGAIMGTQSPSGWPSTLLQSPKSTAAIAPDVKRSRAAGLCALNLFLAQPHIPPCIPHSPGENLLDVISVASCGYFYLARREGLSKTKKYKLYTSGELKLDFVFISPSDQF